MRSHRKVTPAHTAATRRPALSLLQPSGRAHDGVGVEMSATRVRDRLVRRAQSRAATGYYERPAVQKRLVDALWEEFFTG